jgi:hypothetical protein
MGEKILLADENINELGLGDLVNRFSSLRNSENFKTIVLFRNLSGECLVFELENIIRDIVKNKDIEVRVYNKLNDLLDCNSIEKGELNPELETQLVFSEDELTWAKKILEKCGFKGDEKILAICNNIPGRTKRKMWLSKQWIFLLENVLKTKSTFKIVLLPNFRDLNDQADQEIVEHLAEKYPKVDIFSFQEWIGDNLREIIKAQESFGKSKNKIGFSIRQYGAIFLEVFKNKESFAIFNDSGLAHLAVASVGKIKAGKVISVNVENENYYRLRNDGKSFSFEKDGNKTDPERVASYISG